MVRRPGSVCLGSGEEGNAALVQVRANRSLSDGSGEKMVSKDICKVPKSNIKPLRSN